MTMFISISNFISSSHFSFSIPDRTRRGIKATQTLHFNSRWGNIVNDKMEARLNGAQSSNLANAGH